MNKKTYLGNPPVPAIVGPTASGKSVIALFLAENLGKVIISADSRQVYKEVDIGTAKPTLEERLRVQHLFVDFLEISREYNAAEFGQNARKKICMLLSEKIIPVICGGSGLYIRALVDGLFEGPGKNQEVRERIDEEGKRFGMLALFEKLKEVDPVSASKMDATKKHRIIRALEVYYATGRPISNLHRVQPEQAPFPVLQYALEWDRKLLYERIDRRTDEMIEKGLIDEVRGILAKGSLPGMNALNTVGYKEVIEFLEGKCTKEEMRARIKQNTRHYAKRQMTWFRADKRIRWIHADEKTNLLAVAESILEEIHAIRDIE